MAYFAADALEAALETDEAPEVGEATLLLTEPGAVVDAGEPEAVEPPPEAVADPEPEEREFLPTQALLAVSVQG